MKLQILITIFLAFHIIPEAKLLANNKFQPPIEIDTLSQAPSQEPPADNELLQLMIENLIEESEDEIDVSELFDELEVLRERPLNLNTADAGDLKRIFFLTDIQINNLLLHRQRFGNFLSLVELQTVEGFNREIIDLLLPYVVVNETVRTRQMTFNDIATRGKHQYYLRYQQNLQQQRGFLDEGPDGPVYTGNPMRLYTRYRYTYYNNLSIGFTAEKDAGEEFFKGSQPNGFDFYSGHFYLRDVGVIKSLAIGDYQVQFGQGLTLWSGLAFGKGSDAVNIKRNGLGMRPYTSVDENNFMRGAGTTIQIRDFEISGFYSDKRRDANILEFDTILEEATVITSLQQTGLHRTPAELDDKNALRETFIGGNLTWRKSSFHIGATGYTMNLGAEYQRNLSFYNQYDLSSNTNYNLGVDYSYIFRNFHFFGEAATSQNGGFAILNGVMLGLDPKLSISLLHRKFSVDYQSLLSNAFSSGTRVANEEGIFLGLNARLSNQWSINAFADHFVFPWMRFRTYAPSRGYDYMLQINYKPERKTELYLRYRLRNKPVNSPLSDEIRFIDDQIRQNIRFHISYEVSPSFTLKNRFEWTGFDFGNTHQTGYLIYQDVAYRNLTSPWALTLRYAIFNTDGFDSRLYAYENDVLYAFSFPFYSDKGHRVYLVARYRLNRNIDLQARIAHIVYDNRNEVGSGWDLIDGNARTEVKAQIRLRF